MKRFDMDSCKEMDTPMGSETYVEQDESGVFMNITKYLGMIGWLLYLTTSHPGIMFSVCLCACFQENPEESHIITVKRIMNYLKGKTNVGLWYPKGSLCDLVSYFESDYGCCKIDRKSTSGTCHILGNALLSWSYKKQACDAVRKAEA